METKKVVAKPTELSDDMQKAIEVAVQDAMKGKSTSSGDMDQIVKIQQDTAEALKRIADNAVPSNAKSALDAQEKDFEDPYVEAPDKVGVLTVSTADLSTLDGWPGKQYIPIPGQFTKQGLQKRLALPVEIEYDPSMESKYSFNIMSREDFEKNVLAKRGISGIPYSTMVATLSARAGGE